MDVVLIEAYFVNIDGKPLLEPEHRLEHELLYRFAQQRLPILYGDLDVVVAFRDVVVPVPHTVLHFDVRCARHSPIVLHPRPFIPAHSAGSSGRDS